MVAPGLGSSASLSGCSIKKAERKKRADRISPAWLRRSTDLLV
ncbi:hypothetical protein TERTU_2385 [Teredinibacter turnerae T7901]|uniref:Uncharacterized protein n=1 Tax=Teredinibacter turnerae (strain ATCC 39867 / T7901) TaxID=377629 RepID=C5BKC2_TERTT|nr:hypothetical protein TERTU_2385 [Teredinibacter turnerae T7901]